jgi:hypothetical protein
MTLSDLDIFHGVLLFFLAGREGEEGSGRS